MKIIHTSDTHSYFLPLPMEGELVIHSGDLLPNVTRGNRKVEEKFQTEWIVSNIEKFKFWLEGRPFIFCQGNHDFIPVCDILNQFNIEAYNITNNFLYIKDYHLYGFPYVPYICGEWNFEKRLPEMQNEISMMIENIKDIDSDILVAHCPPYGILDKMFNEEHVGNTALANAMAYEALPKNIKYILCGHIHEAHGFAEIETYKISQAATVAHLLEI